MMTGWSAPLSGIQRKNHLSVFSIFRVMVLATSLLLCSMDLMMISAAIQKLNGRSRPIVRITSWIAGTGDWCGHLTAMFYGLPISRQMVILYGSPLTFLI